MDHHIDWILELFDGSFGVADASTWNPSDGVATVRILVDFTCQWSSKWTMGSSPTPIDSSRPSETIVIRP
jgi:hypothetical protein